MLFALLGLVTRRSGKEAGFSSSGSVRDGSAMLCVVSIGAKRCYVLFRHGDDIFISLPGSKLKSALSLLSSSSDY